MSKKEIRKAKSEPQGWVIWNSKINGQASGPASFTSSPEALDALTVIVSLGIKGAKHDLDQLKETKRRITFKDPRDERNFKARVGMLEQVLTEKKQLTQVLTTIRVEEAERRIKAKEDKN